MIGIIVWGSLVLEHIMRDERIQDIQYVFFQRIVVSQPQMAFSYQVIDSVTVVLHRTLGLHPQAGFRPNRPVPGSGQ